MRVNRKSTSLVAAVVGALFIALTQPPVAANGAARATSNNNLLTVNSATLQVIAVDTATATLPNATYSVAVNKSNPVIFYIRNTGSLTTSAFTLTISLDSGAKISTLHRCNVGVYFNATVKKCGPTAIAATQIVGSPTASPYTTNQTLTLAANAFYAFQIDVDKNCTMTVGTLASLSNVTGSTYNS